MTGPRGRREHYFSRNTRDDSADPWIADAITRAPGTPHIRRFGDDKPGALDFGRALFNAARHYGISCKRYLDQHEGEWVIRYWIYRKADGRAHVRGQRDTGRALKYDKLQGE